MRDARILLVEDSDTQALQFRRMAEREGCTVERTRTAEAALDRMNAGLPDLLVVDYRLPGMNGDELVRILRHANGTRTLPILMLTGDDARDLERQGLDSGANAYVPKSEGSDLIVSRMRSLLRQRRGQPAVADTATPPSFRSARLLLIEQDVEYRDFLSALLIGDGHGVETIADPAGAPPLLRSDPIDCVLVGRVGSPEEQLSLCRVLDTQRTAENASYELVTLSADGVDAIVAGLGAGADDVVPRTDERDMLLVRMRSIVRRKMARNEEATAAARDQEREVALARARAEAEGAAALAQVNRALAAANTRLRDTQAQLVQSAKMASLGELVAGIAHEINNPLAFILAHQTTVERAIAAATDTEIEPQDRAQKLAKAGDRLASIRTGLTRIQELVVKLRRFSRLDDGEISSIDIPDAIDAVLTLLGPKLGDGLVVERRYGPQRMLECSGALVNQVVMNIVANAADAVDPNEGRIVIETGDVDGAFIIRIVDNGPGIPPDKRERVFEPFFTTKDVGSGTGLGLAIAYGVVRSHGGTLTIGDGDGGGASFTIKIPHGRS